LNATWTAGFFGFRTVLLTARERRACIGFVSLEAAQRTTQLDINMTPCVRNRLVLGVIVPMLVGLCSAAMAEAIPAPCRCRISCWLIYATPDSDIQKFLAD
jgi:hypothetical protein